MSVLTALALCRFLRDGSAVLLWGGSLFVAVLAPAALRDSLRRGWERLRALTTMILALSLLALLPVQGAALGAGWSDAFDVPLLHDLLLDTTIGTAWMVQAVAAGLLVAVPRLSDRWRPAAAAACSGVLLAGLTLTGHAAMREGWAGYGQRGVDAVHILAGGFWLGALLPLLPTLRVLREPSLHPAASVALRRFSWLGHGAVALVLTSGTAQAMLILGHWPDPTASSYETLFVVKVGFVALMTALALVNRYRFVPQIGQDPAGAIRRIRRATFLEIGFGLGAVGLVAVFGLLEPN